MRPWRKHMQAVFQDPYGSLSPHYSVLQIIAEGLRAHTSLSDAQREAVGGRPLRKWVWTPQYDIVTLMIFPEGSANASPSLRRWCSNPS